MVDLTGYFWNQVRDQLVVLHKVLSNILVIGLSQEAQSLPSKHAYRIIEDL
jgi:hypothetical protein